ncbi:hypothetical protein [Endozoicomonas sp. SCSIO W0465]|uniref:hypothetical protein n=1 Tax=Endozoicomonas sp. SCSIO W0465 TaxID=2918516 RepID=UPI0020760570|nr:hypothetical protein [Endozoicomonas sp. SCSIO W0465]USE35240.1 hypothetical protein MJO57_24540 [Endozoicomonas sp. SCSIO W0465]
MAEFYYQGVRTSMVEELQRGSILSHSYLGFLEESVERSCKSSDQYDEKAQCIEALLEAVNELPEEVIPEVATDPQVFAYTSDGEPELLLSPVVNTGLQNEINLRLADYDWWLVAAIHTGTGNDIHTYGSLLSDSGGYLRVLRSVTPVEKKGEFRLLIDQLSLAGHLYDFTWQSPRILSIGQSYGDNETGQVRRWSRFEQQKAVKVESRRIVRALFSHYRKLNFYFGLGKRLPIWCRNLLEQRSAQLYLIDGDTKTSTQQKVIIEDIKPLLFDHLTILANENDLTFVEYHQKAVEDAIRDYLQSS